MKYITVFVFTVLLAPLLPAEELLRELSVGQEARTVSFIPGKQFQSLLEITDPGISSPVYALKGMIRYENVQGDGYLQMDNHFGAKGTFVTKSVAPTGPLGKISGTSDWRPFILPFYANSGDQSSGAAPTPEKLTLALYLPAAGTVSISDVALYQYASGEDPLQPATQWLSNRNVGLLGGIGGGLLGLWGALIGILSGRGKARGFVLYSAHALLVLGIASIIGGGVALASGQPYVVYYPFLLLGVIVVAVTGMLRGRLTARYEQLELKKMQSMDA